MAMKHGPCLLLLTEKRKGKKKKDSGFRNQVHEETSPHLLLGAQDQKLGAEQDQLPCGNLHGLGMSHVITASQNPSFWAPWRVGDAVTGRGNAGWIASKGGHPCPCQNCSQRPPAEKTGRGSLLNRPSSPPPSPPPNRTTQLVKGLK